VDADQARSYLDLPEMRTPKLSEVGLMDAIKPLLEKLEAAKFSGYLELHLDRGKIVSAELRHWISNSEFEKPLPTIEEPKQ